VGNKAKTGNTTDRGGRRNNMALTIDQCNVTKNTITITFSAAVDQTTANTLSNYTVFDANSVDFAETPAVTIDKVVSQQNPGSSFSANAATSANIVTLTFSPSTGKREFQPGDMVTVIANAVNANNSADTLTGGIVNAQVPGQGPITRGTRDVEDAISYPILTEEVSYRPSPVGIQTTGGGGIAGPGAFNLGQVALQAVTDVLGWKANPADPKGFIGALTQSFTLKDVEGHVESTWTPRTYAVQTDLGGGITGAQASLYSRAKDALDQSLTLLNGLYPLDPEADPEYVKALREMARSQMTEIVKELGMVGLPSILRIDTYFNILLGQDPSVADLLVQFDPDLIAGTLGEIRNVYGIKFRGNKFNNSVEDEQDITNFRVISDYMTSLMQSWIANREFFEIKPNIPAFFGTQLVLISRQFNVIAETVNEARFALDSVFIGPNERQTLLLEFHDPSLPAMFLEDVLDEIDKFVGDEGSRLLRDGGKISVKNNILPVVRSLKRMIDQAHHPKNIGKLPDGFRTARVQHALDDLRDQLKALIELTEQVEQDVPQSEGTLTITGVSVPAHPKGAIASDPYSFSIYGSAFEFGTEVAINSAVAAPIALTVQFFSAERIDVTFNPNDSTNPLPTGDHDVTVTNPDGQTFIFTNAFHWDGSNFTAPPPSATAVKSAAAKQARATRNRAVQVSVMGQPIGSGGTQPAAPASTAPSGSSAASTGSAPTTGAAITAQPTTPAAPPTSTPSSGPAAPGSAAVPSATTAATTASPVLLVAPSSAPSTSSASASGTAATAATATTPAPAPSGAGSPAPAPMPTMADIDGLNQKITDLEQKLLKVSETLDDLPGKKRRKKRSPRPNSRKQHP
jgi:hypothetical protein